MQQWETIRDYCSKLHYSKLSFRFHDKFDLFSVSFSVNYTMTTGGSSSSPGLVSTPPTCCFYFFWGGPSLRESDPQPPPVIRTLVLFLYSCSRSRAFLWSEPDRRVPGCEGESMRMRLGICDLVSQSRLPQ